jgi:hypothetical protein
MREKMFNRDKERMKNSEGERRVHWGQDSRGSDYR